MITFKRFSVTTPKWPHCCAEHAALLSNPSGIRHTGPPLLGAWLGDFAKTEPILGQKGKPRDWGMRGLSGRQAEWRVSQQQEAHLPPERCPPDEERCQPTARNSSGPGRREGNAVLGKRSPSLNTSALKAWFSKGLTPQNPAGTKGYDSRGQGPRTLWHDPVTLSLHRHGLSVNREVTWHP